jgi:nicotinamide mononucleotide (NMN) deamidase PncC
VGIAGEDGEEEHLPVGGVNPQDAYITTLPKLLRYNKRQQLNTHKKMTRHTMVEHNTRRILRMRSE